MPALVIHGHQDLQIDGDAVVAELKPYFDNLDIVMVQNAGHAVPFDQLDEVSSGLLKFVARVSDHVK